MKTVLIVDDEKPARELLKMLIDWESAGYRITSEARDGKEALELYTRHLHDLIITDIQMPLLDGLSFIREVKKMNRDQSVIVLSCHENFHYAREVMKLGVFDYLIKDALTPEDMYTVLKNTAAHEFRKRGAVLPRDRSVEQKSRALWNLIQDRQDSAADSAALAVCHLGDNVPYFLLHALGDAADGTGPESAVAIDAAVTALLAAEGGAVCHLGGCHFVILALAKTSPSQLDMLNNRYAVAHDVQVLLEELAGCRISVGVSRVSSDRRLIREKNLEAQQALGYRVFLGKGKILYYDILHNNARSIKLDLIDTRIKNIRAALAQKQADCMNAELKNLYLTDLQGVMQYNYIQHVNALLLGIISTACAEYNIDYQCLFADGTIPLDAIRDLETVAEMQSWFTAKFQALVGAMAGISDEDYNRRIRKIVQYIKAHYAEDIGLESIAALFNMHKVHLARMFKENTGHSVNGYIRDLRIGEAKDLLKNSDLNVSEIVYKVGFNNFQSFYAVFKKHVGVAPLEYRDRE